MSNFEWTMCVLHSLCRYLIAIYTLDNVPSMQLQHWKENLERNMKCTQLHWERKFMFCSYSKKGNRSLEKVWCNILPAKSHHQLANGNGFQLCLVLQFTTLLEITGQPTDPQWGPWSWKEQTMDWLPVNPLLLGGYIDFGYLQSEGIDDPWGLKGSFSITICFVLYVKVL